MAVEIPPTKVKIYKINTRGLPRGHLGLHVGIQHGSPIREAAPMKVYPKPHIVDPALIDSRESGLFFSRLSAK